MFWVAMHTQPILKQLCNNNPAQFNPTVSQ